MATIAEVLGGKSLNIAEALENFNSGGSFELVNITPNGHLGNVTAGTMDKTVNELMAAHTAGKLIFARMELGNGAGPDGRTITLTYDGNFGFHGAAIMTNQATSKVCSIQLTIYNDGEDKCDITTAVLL